MNLDEKVKIEEQLKKIYDAIIDLSQVLDNDEENDDFEDEEINRDEEEEIEENREDDKDESYRIIGERRIIRWLVERILRKIERNNPGIFRTMRRYGMPYPVARNLVRRVIYLTLIYCWY